MEHPLVTQPTCLAGNTKLHVILVIYIYIYLKPEDLENVRVSSLLSLVANTGLGLFS
jgi:hypothetical protein